MDEEEEKEKKRKREKDIKSQKKHSVQGLFVKSPRGWGFFLG